MLVPILIVIGGIILGIVVLLWRVGKYSADEKISAEEKFKLFGMFVAIVVIIVLGIASFTSVGVGHAVIIVDPVFNTVSGPNTGPAWFFRYPWTQPVDVYYAMTSTEMWTDQESGEHGEYGALRVLSKDGLDIEVDILIRYQLDPNSLVELYRSFPDLKYEDRAISSIVREDVRDVISQYTALEIIEQREMISQKMTETIYNSLISETSLHQALLESSIEIDLRDIDPPPKFKEAIEAKLTAEQQKIQAEFERQRIVILANATAQEMIIKAEGEATSRILIANATKKAIELIIESAGITNATQKAELAGLIYSWMSIEKTAEKNPKMLLMITIGEDGTPMIYQLPEMSP